MSIFGFYFVTTMLRQHGWPRRRGLFNSEAIVDTLIADIIINQMVDWSAALGACRPRLALQVIARMFHDRDWEGENAPRILDFINEAKDVWNAQGNKAPHDIVESFKLSKHGKKIKSKDLKDDRIRTGLEQICLEGLLWGLANPDRFKTWYESQEKSQRDRLPLYKKAGIAELAALAIDTASPAAFSYLAYSDSTTAHDATHTTIQGTESQRESGTKSRVTTTVTNDSARLVKAFTISATETIGCCAIFNAASSGDMLCRTVLTAARSVVSGDTWTATYTVKFA